VRDTIITRMTGRRGGGGGGGGGGFRVHWSIPPFPLPHAVVTTIVVAGATAALLVKHIYPGEVHSALSHFNFFKDSSHFTVQIF